MKRVKSACWLTCLLALLLSMSCGQKASVQVSHLLVNALPAPLAVTDSVPLFSWQLQSETNDVRQTGYRLLVASSPQLLQAGTADLWDSGDVPGDRSQFVPYEGVTLNSRQQCYWTVKVQTNRGASSWSPVSTWRMALLNKGDWKAQWIGHSALPDDVLSGKTRVPARYLRREFALQQKEVSRATLYICGLGLYEAFLNGHRVGKQQLAPTPTGYNVETKYNVFDVTPLIEQQGANALGVTLGNGRYVSMRMPGGRNLGIPNVTHYDMPKLLLQLEVDYADGSRETICSNEAWKITTSGPIRANNEFDGETYDARMEMPGWDRAGFDASGWLPVELVNAPGAQLTAQQNPNIIVMDTLAPQSLTRMKDGKYLIDMGQNMVGWLQMALRGGEPGDMVTLRFAETLNADSSLYTANLRSAEATDRYIVRDASERVWHPIFTYHGFRYVEVSGLRSAPQLSDFQGQVLYDEMGNLGSFSSSSDMLNKITANAFWGIRGNYRGMPTDCPQRDERMGWFGDRTTGCYGESYLFDNHHLYDKWLDDIEQSMTADGVVPDVSPAYWSIYTDNITWPGAFITAADMLYERFGDERPIRKHYAAMKQWLEHMKQTYGRNGLIVKDTYGDWCMPPERPELIHSQDPARITDGALLSTAFYYHLCTLMAKFAALTGQTTDETHFTAEAQSTCLAFNAAFFDASEHRYANNTVTANLLPLRFGMVPDAERQEVFNNILRTTMNDFGGHVSTGVVGIQHLMRGLTDYGRGDVALQIATNTTYPSWGYMVENGATTIWELWNGNTADPAMNSGNHVMLLGDLLIWEYDYLAGIANAPGSAGFKQVLLRPHPVPGLNHVEGSYASPYGMVRSAWQKADGILHWQFTIPCNSSGVVCVPVAPAELDDAVRQRIIDMGGKPVADTSPYQCGTQQVSAFVFPSGNYSLEVPFAE